MTSSKIILALAATLLGTASASAWNAAEHGGKLRTFNVQSTDGYLNLRLGPTPAYGVVIAIPQEAQVQADECISSITIAQRTGSAITSNADWCHVRYGNSTGWVNANLLHETVPGAIAPPITIAPLTAPVSTTQQIWNRFIDKLTAAGAEYGHGCQIEFNTCYESMLAKLPDGSAVAATIRKNTQDEIIKREVCSFNRTLDLRTCFDFDDSDQKWTEMKDNDGHWYAVSK